MLLSRAVSRLAISLSGTISWAVSFIALPHCLHSYISTAEGQVSLRDSHNFPLANPPNPIAIPSDMIYISSVDQVRDRQMEIVIGGFLFTLLMIAGLMVSGAVN